MTDKERIEKLEKENEIMKKKGFQLGSLFLSEFGIDLEEGRDQIGHGTGADDDEEEGLITY